MLPHARDELTALAEGCHVSDDGETQGWNRQTWTLTDEDVDRAVAAYQALLAVDVGDELGDLLADLDLDRLGPAAETEQHARVMRADATELMATATAIAFDGVHIDDLFMPNIPKMAGQKSDSGIDVVGVELDVNATGPVGAGENLILVSVKHTIGDLASSVRGKLEKSVTDELPTPYLHRQLTVIHGRLIQEGVNADVARRIFYFMRDTLKNPNVRIICVAAAAPPPACNLPDQPALLASTDCR